MGNIIKKCINCGGPVTSGYAYDHASNSNKYFEHGCFKCKLFYPCPDCYDCLSTIKSRCTPWHREDAEESEDLERKRKEEAERREEEKRRLEEEKRRLEEEKSRRRESNLEKLWSDQKSLSINEAKERLEFDSQEECLNYLLDSPHDLKISGSDIKMGFQQGKVINPDARPEMENPFIGDAQKEQSKVKTPIKTENPFIKSGIDKINDIFEKSDENTIESDATAIKKVIKEIKDQDFSPKYEITDAEAEIESRKQLFKDRLDRYHKRMDEIEKIKKDFEGSSGHKAINAIPNGLKWLKNSSKNMVSEIGDWLLSK